MANNADVDYVIISKDKAIIRELAEAFEDNYDPYKALKNLGIDTDNLNIRAIVNSSCKALDDSQITVNMTTAWGHQRDFDKALNDKYGDKVEVYFEEYEPGCGLFSTNDMDGTVFQQNYVVDCDCEEEFHLNEKEVAEHYKEALGEFPDGVEVTHEMLMERAETYNKANEDDDCKFIYIYRLEREQD